MAQEAREKIIELILGAIEIPDSAYEKAAARYGDIGGWLHRPEAGCFSHEPRVFAQGSFRLGTVVRPLNADDDYDLDLACELRSGISRESHSQKELKTVVGHALRTYRAARGIVAPLTAKHRCWRLEYADGMSFHMDIVPCIPEDDHRRKAIMESLSASMTDEAIVRTVADAAVNITDDRDAGFSRISADWPVSNPEGYARWFEHRTKLAATHISERATSLKVASIDELPTYRWKTPLQRCVQVLKRHRDQMFGDDPRECKPISIIITTLAARAYAGEVGILEAVTAVLERMDEFAHPTTPRVPNPVNPEEDFADKWGTAKGRASNLEGNFRNWLSQARTDFQLLATSPDPDLIVEKCRRSFACRLDESAVRGIIGGVAPTIITEPRTETLRNPPRPWGPLVG